MSQPKPDFMLIDPERYPIAAIDVKNFPDFSKESAMRLRRSWSEYGYKPRTPYVLILSQDKGYLWKQPEQADPSAYPAYEFSMHEIVKRYKADPAKWMDSMILEMLVHQWLFDLTFFPREADEEPEKTLALSGFKDAVKGATIVLENEI